MGTASEVTHLVSETMRSRFPWLQEAALICACGLVFSLILYVVESLKHLVDQHGEDSDLLSKVDRQVEQTFQLARQKAVVSAVEPHNAKVFNYIFGDAEQIWAYNPPLTLLIFERDQTFRNIIFNFLQRTDKQYRSIVGRQGVERLLQLKELWAKEKTRRKADAAMQKMVVTSYTHGEGLHTTQHPWPVFNEDDLRGLSFFLIETQHHRKILLYILGKPFVDNFEVPSIGLLITEPSDDAKIYDRLHHAFDQRWTTLCTQGVEPEVFKGLPLAQFFDEYNRVNHSTRPGTRVI